MSFPYHGGSLAGVDASIRPYRAARRFFKQKGACLLQQAGPLRLLGD